MPHGPTYFESKGACIYCGVKNAQLTDEHIVPYSLGGQHVIRKASCLKCANITKKFEQKVARDLWGDARASFNAPSRRKKERPSIMYMGDGAGRIGVPAHEFPGGFVFYKMHRAGLLQGFHESVDVSQFWELIVIDDDKRRENFHARYPGKLRMKFRHVPQEFGQVLIKIGYGHILTQLDPTDFHSFCIPYILGQKTNVSYLVGGTMEAVQPMRDFGYHLGTGCFGSSSYMVLTAIIRLYANTHAPEYHVVVGDVTGEEAVKNVMSKLGSGIYSSSTDAPSHWAPADMLEFKLPM